MRLARGLLALPLAERTGLLLLSYLFPVRPLLEGCGCFETRSRRIPPFLHLPRLLPVAVLVTILSLAWSCTSLRSNRRQLGIRAGLHPEDMCTLGFAR